MRAQSRRMRCQRMRRKIQQHAQRMAAVRRREDQHPQFLVDEFRAQRFQRTVMQQKFAMVGPVHIAPVVILIALARIEIKVGFLPVRLCPVHAFRGPFVNFFFPLSFAFKNSQGISGHQRDAYFAITVLQLKRQFFPFRSQIYIPDFAPISP